LKTNLTCINCPSGCALTVTLDEQRNIIKIEGNQCKLGEKYAQTEITNPTRTVTSTVRLANAAIAQLPVKTSKPIPKGKIMDCMRALKPVEVTAPVSVGDVIVPHVCGTDADIVATRSVQTKEI
jgi:CxxC motif-containing protein